MYHLYVFGAKRGKHDARARTTTKRRRKGKKEKKWVRGECMRGSVCSVCKQRVEPGEEICNNCKTLSIWRVC